MGLVLAGIAIGAGSIVTVWGVRKLWIHMNEPPTDYIPMTQDDDEPDRRGDIPFQVIPPRDPNPVPEPPNPVPRPPNPVPRPPAPVLHNPSPRLPQRVRQAQREEAARRIGIDTTNYNIAFCGSIKVGKSTLINSLRGLLARDRGASLVDVIPVDIPREVNTNPKEDAFAHYKMPHPQCKHLILWDLPGADEETADEYFMNKCLFAFDCIVVVCCEAFRPLDVGIVVRAQRAEVPVPVLLVRNKLDYYVTSAIQGCEKPAGTPPHEIAREISLRLKQDVRRALQRNPEWRDAVEADISKCPPLFTISNLSLLLVALLARADDRALHAQLGCDKDRLTKAVVSVTDDFDFFCTLFEKVLARRRHLTEAEQNDITQIQSSLRQHAEQRVGQDQIQQWCEALSMLGRS